MTRKSVPITDKCSRGSSRSGSNDGTNEAIELTLRQQASLHLSQQEHRPSPLRCFFNALSRKKPLDCRTDTNLNRCLNFMDLTALGVGSTLGLGLYVLAGQVASNKAGPAVVISFALAALASAFSALCYAEFAGRVPRAGSAYAYSYITVGEFVAFIIGWNLILEYVIGASSVARGFSGYLRFVCEHVARNLGFSNNNQQELTSTISTTALQISYNDTIASTPTNSLSGLANVSSRLVGGSSTALLIAASPFNNNTSESLIDSTINYIIEYFDWPSVVIITVLTISVLFGVKESTNVTFAFTALNLIVVVVVVISSLSYLDIHNWQLSKSEVPNGFGEGGFLPYGWSGVLAGSATCFFGFIGFDTIASSAEEAKNPKRNVPLSIISSLFISFIAYMAIAIVQTLLWPYFDQNKVTILPYIFDRLQMPITYWIVLLGAIAGLASSQLGGMYPLPRILYSMAHDRLIYASLANINRKLKLPVRATIVGSIFVALLACLLDIQDLADMVSIGTLAAYSLVSLSVLIMRYEDRSDAVDDSTILTNHLSFTDILSTIEQSTVAGGQEVDLEGDQLDKFQRVKDMIPEEKEQPTDYQSRSVISNKTIINRPKLASKASIPIHEKGSKAVTAQLSAGFNSWFKNNQLNGLNEVDDVVGEKTGVTTCSSSGHESRKQSYLNLLTTWKLSEQMRNRSPTDDSSRQSKILISLIVILSMILDVIVLYQTSAADPSITTDMNGFLSINPKIMMNYAGFIVLAILAAVMLMLSRLPTSQSVPIDVFQVPLVPLIPTLSIFVNTFLMLNLSYLTWVRFTVWMTFGFFIYFTYGIWNSEGYLLYLDR